MSDQNLAAAFVATEPLDLADEIQRLTDGRGAELVLDPVGGPTFAKLVEATASGGLLILYGAPSRDPTVVPPFPIFARNLTIRGLALPAYTADDTQLAALTRFVTEGWRTDHCPPSSPARSTSTRSSKRTASWTRAPRSERLYSRFEPPEWRSR